MKGTDSYRTRDLGLCDILINEERQIITFTKALQKKNKRKTSKMYLFSVFKD